MALMSEQLQLRYLAWRAGFGEPRAVIENWSHRRRKQIVSKVLIGPGKDKDQPLLVMEPADLPDYGNKKIMDAEGKKQLRKLNVQGIKDLNLSWMNAMISSEHPLREKMALFWHGHFACRTQNILFNQQLLQVIRENALGNFGALLSGVSKTPAMLQFLNNQQNRKQHPNENFAREVMELFTLGRGQYTEKDVQEAARAFTGWGFERTGEFVFRERNHDNGEKNVLGKSGNLNGDDVLKILLEQRQTARFITAKLYRFFVDEQVDEERVNMLADKFYSSGYDIKALMQTIFMADWFYEEKYVGVRIKSPVELLVGLRRIIPMQFEKEETMLSFQQVLGQVLFYPPNVAGWPGGRNWIDSSSLMYRMQLPEMILYAQEFNIKPKEITPEMGMGNYKVTMQFNQALKRQYAKKIKATIDWQPYLRSFDKVPREELANAIAGSLLIKNNHVNKQLLEKYADSSSREHYIKTVTIAVMSTPEYQLC